MHPYEFMQKQSLPYKAKIIHAELRAREFETWAIEHGHNICISIGGLDSITLYYFLKSIKINPLPASVSILEDKSIQKIHHQIPGMVFIGPYKSKVQILREYGFPVISKEKASKIENLQKPDNPKQTFIHAIMTGDMGQQGKFQHSNRIKLPEKWIKLFGGLYGQHRPDLKCGIAPFKVSAECCKWMKEKPAQDWQKQNNMIPYLGLMASEGGQREKGLRKNGCNYYGKSTIRSCPFAIFSRQDLLQLAIDLNVPIPSIYGEIKRNSDGMLYTTRAQRTGCSMCGFGIHIEKRPNRFDRLREDNPKEWHFWMYDMGWGKVLDYIGIAWEDEYRDSIEMSTKQLEIFAAI